MLVYTIYLLNEIKTGKCVVNFEATKQTFGFKTIHRPKVMAHKAAMLK